MRTALVSGANRGMGLATSIALARRGMHVILLGRDARALQDAQRQIPGPSRALVADLRDPGALRGLDVEVDVLVNNAAIYPGGTVLGTDTETWADTLQINLRAPLALIKAAVPGMVRRRWGRIVNVSSAYGAFSEGLGGPAAYSVSKAALNGLTVQLAAELPPTVKVNAVCPGWVRTRMGGPGATRSVAEGAAGIIWAATLPDDGPTGGFFRDGQPIAW